MSKKFTVPILLPADPAAPLEAATKQYVDAQAGGGGNLDDIADVDAPTPGANQALVYDQPTGTWVPGLPAGVPTVLTNLNDVDTAVLNPGDILAYDAGTSLWKPAPMPVTVVVADALPGTLAANTLYVITG